MLIQISIDEIKKKPQILIAHIEAGEPLVITKAGQPVAEIKPLTVSDQLTRPFGLCMGEFTVPDDFYDPLPEVLIQEFEGK